MVSKPLPSAEDFEKEQEEKKKEAEKTEKEKKNLQSVFSSYNKIRLIICSMIKKKEPNEESLDWSESKEDYGTQIESSRREVLKEWEEMRKPDEWDLALDMGKSKKVRKNKGGNKRNRKNNPFQEMAQKKQKK